MTEYISWKNLTPEQIKQRKRQLSKNYRLKHPEIIKKWNRYYYELYKITKPFDCICQKCGKPFKSNKKITHKCPDCIHQSRLNAIERNKIIQDIHQNKINRLNKRKKDVLELYQQGLSCYAICKKLNLFQIQAQKIIKDYKKDI